MAREDGVFGQVPAGGGGEGGIFGKAMKLMGWRWSIGRSLL